MSIGKDLSAKLGEKGFYPIKLTDDQAEKLIEVSGHSKDELSDVADVVMQIKYPRIKTNGSVFDL